MIGPDDQDLVSALRWALEALQRRRPRQPESPAESQAWLLLYRAESELVQFWRDLDARAEGSEKQA